MARRAAGKRVLVLLSDAFGGHGGIALYNRDVLTALCGDPDIAEVVALPRVAKLPVGVLPAKLDFDLRALGGGPSYLRAVARRVAQGGFDLVYCAHVNLLPVARVAAAALRAPLLLAIYGIDAWQPSPKRLVRASVSRADTVLSISRVTLDRFRDWSGYPLDRCVIMPNAIHLEWFGVGEKPAALIERYGVGGRKVVMTFGRLAGSERYKGFDTVLEAMPAMRARRPDLVYVIAGDGEDRARLQDKARALGQEDHVVFTGMVDEREKADHYRLADVYAMPSRGEGFGFVLLEAMACGIPTIGSAADGGREALRDGLLGPLVDPGDPAALVEAILDALDRPRAVPEGLDYFGFPRFSERLMGALHTLMARA